MYLDQGLLLLQEIKNIWQFPNRQSSLMHHSTFYDWLANSFNQPVPGDAHFHLLAFALILLIATTTSTSQQNHRLLPLLSLMLSCPFWALSCMWPLALPSCTLARRLLSWVVIIIFTYWSPFIVIKQLFSHSFNVLLGNGKAYRRKKKIVARKNWITLVSPQNLCER